MIVEDEYCMEIILFEFLYKFLGKDFWVSYVFGSDSEWNKIFGFEVFESVDMLIVSVWWWLFLLDDMSWIWEFVSKGKLVIGICMVSYVFVFWSGDLFEGLDDWLEFDVEIFGGNYYGYYGNDLKLNVMIVWSEDVEEIGVGSFVSYMDVYEFE